MIREHYRAAEALLEGLNVYVGRIEKSADDPDPPKWPYVLLWGDPGEAVGLTLDDAPQDYEIRMRATCGGLTFDSVVWMIDAVRGRLDRAQLVVPGWRPGELHQGRLQGIQMDPNVEITGFGNPLFAVDEYVCQTSRD